jgi:aspartyl/asparaginyl-tRNA synthetase
MAKTFKTIILIGILVFSFAIPCKAKDYNNYNDLIENSKKLDNSEITLKGEAIGEAMNRGEYSWVNISDGSTAMGIWIDSKQAQSIKNFGKYGYKGDIVEINGVFNRACTQHGGDMDVHASTVKIIDAGGTVTIPISNNKKAISLILSLITITLIFSYFKFTKSISK